MIETLEEFLTEYKLWEDGLGFSTLEELRANTLDSVLEEFDNMQDIDGQKDAYINQNYDDLSDGGGFYPSQIGED
ncbi:MAG: hypothetical protein IKO39_07270 [Treponema sp.]|nr:hypothetical protein [Treponema sp.]